MAADPLHGSDAEHPGLGGAGFPRDPADPTRREGMLDAGEIESLLKHAGLQSSSPRHDPQPAAYGGAGTSHLNAPLDAPRSGAGVAPRDVELLLNQAEQALASINHPSQASDVPGIKPFRLADFAGAAPSSEMATLDLIRDVELDLKIELGRTHMYLEDVLKLCKGAVVPLDKLAGDPVDIFVNGRLIARGEVLILNDNFCVRVAELVAGEKAVAK